MIIILVILAIAFAIAFSVYSQKAKRSTNEKIYGKNPTQEGVPLLKENITEKKYKQMSLIFLLLSTLFAALALSYLVSAL